jgi:hypothetical protein
LSVALVIRWLSCAKLQVALVVVVPATLWAQPGAGVVTGRVSAPSEGGLPNPLAGAEVSIVGLALGTTTDADGRYLIARVPAGDHVVRARLMGHRRVDRPIHVAANDTIRVNFSLPAEAQLLVPVRTSAPANEAELFLSRPSVATISMGAAAMAGVPSVGEPDVVRVVQLLPGVVARNDFNTGLVVRGGEADQNLVLLDGHAIHNPFHLGGLFSTFMDATVGGIDLMTGAFPVRFGGRLSSVLDVRSAENVQPGVHVSADISALAASTRLAGTVGKGRGAWSVAGRRTYADAMARIFTNNIFPYHFHDYHARGAYLLSSHTRVSVTAYAGRDVLDANLAEFESDSSPSKAGGGSWAFDWGNLVLGATLVRGLPKGLRIPGTRVRIGDSATVEQRLSTSGFSTVLDLGQGAFAQRSEIRDVTLGGSLLTHGTSHDVSVGYELASHRIRYASSSAQTGIADFDFVQTPVSGALWIGDLWRTSPRLLIEAGVRAELLTGRDWMSLSPRLSLKYFLTQDVALTAAAGRVTQWMHSLAGDGALRYFDIWIASDEFTPVATAWHYVAGAERRLDAGSIRIEGYAKRYDRVLEANWSEDPGERGDEFFVARGLSYGVDVLARWQPTARVAGWISYSYGLSARDRDGVRWAPGHDRRHDVDLVATWQLARYRVGARVGFASGTPFTPIVGEIARRVYDPARDRWGTGDPPIFVEPLGGRRNSSRFPPTHRLDLDVSREMRVRGATVVPYLSVVNAYNAKNVFVYLYDYSTDRPTRRAISQFPVLPSLGVRVAF